MSHDKSLSRLFRGERLPVNERKLRSSLRRVHEAEKAGVEEVPAINREAKVIVGRGDVNSNDKGLVVVVVEVVFREIARAPHTLMSLINERGRASSLSLLCFSRARTEILSKELGRWLRGSLLSVEEGEMVDAQLREFAMKPGVENAMTPHLAQLYRKGIAFHHAGFDVLLKAFVEQLYEQRLIKVLYCTGTFALGINMPARAAVFDSLERYDGQGMIPLPTREFIMQMAGRAGRRGLDEEGLVAIRMGIDEFADLEPQIRRYLSSSYEPVESRFSLSFNSVVKLLDRHPDERIRELVEKSFLSWRRQGIAEQKRERATQLAQELEQLGLKIATQKAQKKTAASAQAKHSCCRSDLKRNVERVSKSGSAVERV